MINNNNSADVIIDGKTVTVVPQNVSCLISRPNGTFAVAFEDGTVKDVTLSDFNKLKELNYNMAGGGIGSHGIVSDSIVRMEHTESNTLLIDGVPFEGGGGNVTQTTETTAQGAEINKTLLGEDLINYTSIDPDRIEIHVGKNYDAGIAYYKTTDGGVVNQARFAVGNREILRKNSDGTYKIFDEVVEFGGSDIYFDSVNRKIKGMKDENGNEVEISVNTMVVTL